MSACRTTGARAPTKIAINPGAVETPPGNDNLDPNSFLTGAMNWELTFAAVEPNAAGAPCANISLPNRAEERQGALFLLPPQGLCPYAMLSLGERLQSEGWSVYIPRLPDAAATQQEWQEFTDKIAQVLTPETQQRAVLGIAEGATYALAMVAEGTLLLDRLVAFSPLMEPQSDAIARFAALSRSGPTGTTSTTRVQLISVATHAARSQSFADLSHAWQEQLPTGACYFQADTPELFWSDPTLERLPYRKAWLQDTSDAVSRFLRRGLFFAELIQPKAEAGILQCKHRPLSLNLPKPGPHSPEIKKPRPAVWLRGGRRPEALDRRQLRSLAARD
jgi:hypothetical protein